MGTQKDDVGNEWTEAVFDGRGFPLHYYHTLPSSPLPKLVFLHAFTSTGPRQLHIFSGLADAFQIFLPTARGHGKSNPIPAGSFTMDNLIEDVAALVRHISPDQPIFLVGHSMGGATAARFTKKYPELVRGLVLEDPPWRVKAGTDFDPSMAGAGPTMFFQVAKKLQAMSDEEFQKIKDEPLFKFLSPPGGFLGSLFGGMFGGFFGGRGRGPPGMGRGPGGRGPGGRGGGPGGLGGPATGPFAQTDLEGLREFAVDIIEPTFLDKAERYISVAVEEIAVPAMLMTGEPGMAHCAVDVAAATLATWPKGTERNFPGAGHGIHAPPRDGEYREAIRTFFKDL